MRARRAGAAAAAARLTLGPLSPGARGLDVGGVPRGAARGAARDARRAAGAGRASRSPRCCRDGRRYRSRHPSPRSAAGPDLDALLPRRRAGASGSCCRRRCGCFPAPPRAPRAVVTLPDGAGAVGRAARRARCRASGLERVHVATRAGRLRALARRCLRLGGERGARSRQRGGTLFGAVERGPPSCRRRGSADGAEREVHVDGRSEPRCGGGWTVTLCRLSMDSVVLGRRRWCWSAADGGAWPTQGWGAANASGGLRRCAGRRLDPRGCARRGRRDAELTSTTARRTPTAPTARRCAASRARSRRRPRARPPAPGER